MTLLANESVLLETKSIQVKIADTEKEVRDVLNLRYRIFADELGASVGSVDNRQKIERDIYDEQCRHLIVIDNKSGGKIAASTRIIGMDATSKRQGKFYSQEEYNLQPLYDSGKNLLEISRTCVDIKYRGQAIIQLLWAGLAKIVVREKIDYLFGVASFPGNDIKPLRESLSYLYHYHLAQPDLRVKVREESSLKMNLLTKEQIVKDSAIKQMPPLIKAYLRLGGVVGDGAFLDRLFNTIDVFLVVDIKQMNAKMHSLFLERTELISRMSDRLAQ